MTGSALATDMQLTLRALKFESQSHITTDGQSASLYWCQDQIFITVQALQVC
jgi:hypothetical protein